MIGTGRLSAFLIDREQPSGQIRALVSGELYEAVMEASSDHAVGLLIDEGYRRGYITNDMWGWPQSIAALTWRTDDDGWAEYEVTTVEAWRWWCEAAGLRPTEDETMAS